MNNKLKIPDINSDWDTIAEFALTFNGYHYVNGGPELLKILWDRVALEGFETSSIEDIRAMLLLLQRAGRFCGDEGSDNDLEEARFLIEEIRNKMIILK